MVGDYPVNERIHQPAIYLKERTMVHAVVETGGAIGQRRRAPLCNAARMLASTALDDQLSASKRRNPLVKCLRQLIEANLCGAGGKNACQQCVFAGIREERNLRRLELRSKLARNLRKGPRSLNQQRRGNRALAHGNHPMRSASAIAGIPRRIKG